MKKETSYKKGQCQYQDDFTMLDNIGKLDNRCVPKLMLQCNLPHNHPVWRRSLHDKFGYFSTELIKPIAPLYFDDKKRMICILSATSILKILLPERQINKKIYLSFEKMLNELDLDDWIKVYLYWEIFIINQLHI